jgi:hypothetical protein
MAAAKLMFVLSRPPDPSSRTVSEQTTYLQHYKESLLDSDVVAVFVLLLAETLGVEPDLRDPISVQRCDLLLWLLRNLLAVPDPPPTDDPVRDPLTRLHDRMLRLLQQEHFLPLFVFVCESLQVTETGGGDQWALLLLEMLFYILRTETPESLMQARHWRDQVNAAFAAASSAAAADGNGERDPRQPPRKAAPELEALMQRAKLEKRAAHLAMPARHSRWGGKIVLPASRADEPTKMMNTSAAVQALKVGAALPPSTLGRAINVKRAKAQGRVAASALSDETRVALADMCQQLLAVGYAKLMQAFKLAMARDTRESLNQIDDNDRAKYVWVMSLFTGYHTLLERERLAAVPAPTLARWTGGEHDDADDALERADRPVFYIDAIGVTYHRLDVKFVINSISWFANENKHRELCYALDAFDRLLQTAQLLLVSPDRDNHRIAQSIIKSAYYDFLEDSTRSLHSLIINFKPRTQPFALLQQLIATSHTYLKLLSLTSKSGERVFTKVKARKRRPKKKAPATPGVPTVVRGDNDDGFIVADNQPVDGDSTAAAAAALRAEPALTADDAELRAQVEQFLAQRQSDGITGLGAIKAACGKFAPLARGWSAELQQSAVLLIERSTRDAAETDEAFIDDRIALVRTELGATKVLAPTAAAAAQAQEANNNDDDDEEEEEEEVDENDDMRVIQREVSLEDQVRKFAHGSVVQNYCFALQRWHDLSADAIHGIVKMFQRLAVDAKTPALFWQATVLRLFQTLIDDPLVTRTDAKFSDLLRFVDYVLELLFAKMRDDPEQAGQLALEMLFSRARAANNLWSGEDDADADHRLHRDGAAAKRNQLRGDMAREATTEHVVQHRVVRSAAEWSDDENAKLLSFFATFGDSLSTVCDVISAMLDDGTKTAPIVYARLLQLNLVKRGDVPNAAEYEADLFETIECVEHVAEGREPPAQLLDDALTEIVVPLPLDSLEGRDAENSLAVMMHRLLSRALDQYRERMGLTPRGGATDAAHGGDDDDGADGDAAPVGKSGEAKRAGRAAFNPAEAFRWLATQLRAAGRRRADDNETCRESPLYTINIHTDPEAAKWLLPRAPMRPLLKELYLRAAPDDKLTVRVLRGVGGDQLRRFADLLLQCIDDCNAEYERSIAPPAQFVDEDDDGIDADDDGNDDDAAAAAAEQAAGATDGGADAVEKRVKKPKRPKRRTVAFEDDLMARNDEDGAKSDGSDDGEGRASSAAKTSEHAPLAVFAKSRTDALSELRKRSRVAPAEPIVPLPPSKRALQRAALAAAAKAAEDAAPVESAPVVEDAPTESLASSAAVRPVWPIAPTVTIERAPSPAPELPTKQKTRVASAAAAEEDNNEDNDNSVKRRRLKKRATVDSDDDE